MRLSSLKAGRLAALIVGVALVGTMATSSARAEIVGTLKCNIAAGEGAIIGSQRALSCTFISAGGPTDLYNGVISRLGLDIGNISGGTLDYQVVSAGVPGPGSLQGGYVGPGFGVTLGTGGGLTALVGGGSNSITLQPLSATTTTGVNINAGIGALQLSYVGPAGPARRAHRRHLRRMHRHHR